MGLYSIALSERLKALADLVTPGNRAADVGCDHGFLSIYLVQAGISPRAIAMDVRPGPLAAAEEHIAAHRLGAYIDTRMSDGLKALLPGEADTLICAGMGGRLMERILSEGAEKAVLMRELILQPQSEIPQFRKFLRESGYGITDERMIYEGGKYYAAMRAVPGQRKLAENRESGPDSRERLYDRFGKLLLTGKDPVLMQYLRCREKTAAALEERLLGQRTARGLWRLEEVRQELRDIREALNDDTETDGG